MSVEIVGRSCPESDKGHWIYTALQRRLGALRMATMPLYKRLAEGAVERARRGHVAARLHAAWLGLVAVALSGIAYSIGRETYHPRPPGTCMTFWLLAAVAGCRSVIIVKAARRRLAEERAKLAFILKEEPGWERFRQEHEAEADETLREDGWDYLNEGSRGPPSSNRLAAKGCRCGRSSFESSGASRSSSGPFAGSSCSPRPCTTLYLSEVYSSRYSVAEDRHYQWHSIILNITQFAA